MYLYKLLIMQKLLDAKAHLGSGSTYSDTQPYIYGFRNQIAIIDLEKTLISLRRACNVIDLITRSKGHLLFVNTDPEYNKIVKQTAMRANQSFINHKWIGGFLTNWSHMQNVQQHFSFAQLPNACKIPQSMLNRCAPAGPSTQAASNPLRKKSRFARDDLHVKTTDQFRLADYSAPRFKKMQKCFEGAQDMGALPDCVIIFNANHNSIAIHEASLLQIPIISLVDSNISNKLHSLITYPIPANAASQRLIYIVSNCFLKTILLSKFRFNLNKN